MGIINKVKERSEQQSQPSEGVLLPSAVESDGEQLTQQSTQHQNPIQVDIPDIRSSAILVDLTITEWSGSKKDTRASEQVTSMNQAVENSAKVIKELLPKSHLLKDLHNYVARVRKQHIQLTMPWGERGTRLLPTAMLPDYKAWAVEAEKEFHERVTKFVDSYEFELKKVNIELGSLFDAGDYDTKEQVNARFSICYDYIPVPNSGDFRVDVGKEALAELQTSCDTAYARIIEQTTADLWKRLSQPLTNMVNQLQESNFDGSVRGYKQNGEPKEAGFKATLVPNVLDIIKMMKAANWGDDPTMNNAILSLETTLTGVSSDMLKGNTTTRQRVRTTAEQVLKSIPTLNI